MTLSALGIFSAAGAGPVAPASSYELISTTILGTAAASVDFTGLGTYSAVYRHLQIRYTAKSDISTGRDIRVRLNADSSSSYRAHALYGQGTSAFSIVTAIGTGITLSEAQELSTTANAFKAGVIDILDSYSSTKNKTVKSLHGGIDNIFLHSGLWINTASLTAIQLTSQGGNFVTGSRFSLYGIKG